MGTKPEVKWALQKPIVCGATIFTVLWILGMVVLAVALQPGPDADPLTLNEWGDFMAGAFLWLVVGYLLSSHSLQLQAQELASSVEEQKHLVAAAQAQHELAASESVRQHQALKMAHQPRFAINYTISARSNNQVTVDVRFQNVGQTVTDVEMEYLEFEGATDPLYRESPLWQPAHSNDVQFRFPAKEKGVREVLINYRDGLGEAEWQKFAFFYLESDMRSWEKKASIDRFLKKG